MEHRSQRHKITVDEYYRMDLLGLLAPDVRSELIEGEVIEMPRMGSRHAAAVACLCEMLQRIVGDRAHLRGQLPLRLSRFSEPVPDVVVIKRRADFYATRHPEPADTLLAIEVSDSTLRYDRDTKAPLYARYGIPEYWLIDLSGGDVRRYRALEEGTYTDVSSIADVHAVPIPALPGLTIDLSQVLAL